MKFIVGLGNPGKKYEKTRHNIGFMVIDNIKNKISKIKNTYQKLKINKKINSEIFKTSFNGEKVILVKPMTYMNNSGKAVKSLISQFRNFAISDLIIIHDDVDLPLGEIRVKKGSGGAGHHGVKSLIKELGTKNFIRIRLGIGRNGDIEKFVLSLFRKEEIGKVNKMVKEACKKIFALL